MCKKVCRLASFVISYIYIYIYISFEFRNERAKGTHGRGLSNLEMQHVGELPIIGQFLKAVKTSWVHTVQSLVRFLF